MEAHGVMMYKKISKATTVSLYVTSIVTMKKSQRETLNMSKVSNYLHHTNHWPLQGEEYSILQH